MKVKMTIWAEVDEDEYYSTTDVKSELALIRANMVGYDSKTHISRKEWEEDGLDWNEEDEK